MQRFHSKGSVNSTSSSTAAGKRVEITHMIMQRHEDSRFFMLPISHLVNGNAARLKQNDKATFKTEKSCRKQYRGTIIILGSEDLCTEQAEVLGISLDERENSDSQDPLEQNSNIEEREDLHDESNRTNLLDKICQDRSPTNVTSERGSNISLNRSMLTNKTIKKIQPSTRSSITVLSRKDHGKKTVDQRQHLNHRSLTEGKSLNQKNSSSRNKNRDDQNTNKLSKQQTTNISDLVNKSLFDADSDNDSRSAVGTNMERERSQSIDFQGQTNEEIDLSTNLSNNSSDYFLAKKYNRILRENLGLKLECERLRKENENLKRTTIPMPDAGARQWFLNVAKIFSTKPRDMNIFEHAKKLGIQDQEKLILCIQDTTSNTARHVIRLLYTPDRLCEMSGTEIPVAQRQAIREFAEFHRGPISNHKFNEAVNGVFRQEKLVIDKKQKVTRVNEGTCTTGERQQNIYGTVRKTNNDKQNYRERFQSKENHPSDTFNIADESSMI